MHKFLLPPVAGLLALALQACSVTQTGSPVSVGDVGSSSSVGSAAAGTGSLSLTMEGIVQKAGASIFLQASHRLVGKDGSVVLLESPAGNLDAYINSAVRVSGTTRATVEAGGTIMTVRTIDVLPDERAPVILEEAATGASSSRAPASSSSKALQPSPAQSSNPKPAVSTSAAAPVSSVFSSPQPPPPASSSHSTSSLASSTFSASTPASADQGATVKAMAKVSVDAASFSTQYCNGHIGFCVPLHRNWFYQSFGANVSPYFWHVEISSRSVEEVGQGVLMVNLLSGPVTAATEGAAEERGDFVVAQRQWTGGRHFEISGPRELRSAVEYMARGLSVYQEGQ